MPDITHLNGIALVKKKGNKLYVVSDPEGVADESPIIAEGTTTPRMLKDRFADIANVKDYGAVGDGQHDDTEAVQAAMNAGGLLFFPRGTYVVTVNINSPAISDMARVVSYPGQNGTTIGNLVIASGCTLIGNDIGASQDFWSKVDLANNQLTFIGRGCGRNLGSTADTTTAIGQGCISGETVDDALSNYSPYTGHDNVVIGFHCGKRLTTAEANVGIGRDALNCLTDGIRNTAVGTTALQQLIHGNSNTVFGCRAGMRMGTTTDADGTRVSTEAVYNNTFIGESAGRETRIGSNNTYVGYSAGRGVTSESNQYTGTSTGEDNTVVGSVAFSKVSTGSRNSIIGKSAATNLESGTDNVIIGYSAGSAAANTVNAVIVGSRAAMAATSASNSVIIGCNAVREATNLDNVFAIGGSGSVPYLQGTMNSDSNTLRVDASFTPSAGDTYILGSAAYKWSTIFAANGTIVTSDFRCKQNIANPAQALLKAWGNVGFKVFQFKDAVEKKGESSARYHVGVIAQDVQTAFTEQGLDVSKYGLFCHDSWEDEYETIEVVDQPEVLNEAGEVVTPAVVHTEQRKVLDAGDRFGIRYEEALALECAYLRGRLSKIETALATHGITLGDE